MARFDTPTQLYESSTAQYIDSSILALVFPPLWAGGKAGVQPSPRFAGSVPESPSVNRNDECTENGKLSAQKTVTTVHKNQ